MNLTLLIPAVALAVVALVVFLVIFLGVKIHNGLVARKNAVSNAFADVDVMLKKRFDLIPNLVAVVKQYMQHEADTLIKIAQMRAQAGSRPIDPSAQVQLDNQLTRALGGLMVAVEKYPDLKANEQFLELQGTLNNLEEELSAARRFFNTCATSLNNAIQMFPSSMVASRMQLTRSDLFSISEGERQVPNVKAMFAP